MDFGEAITLQKKRISTYITADVAKKLFSLPLPHLLALPYNPYFKDYVEKKGVEFSQVLSVAKDYALPGKLQVAKIARNIMTDEILSNVFFTPYLEFTKIQSKGKQVEFLANTILDKHLCEGLKLSEKQLVNSGIIQSKDSVSNYLDSLKKHFNKGSKKTDKIVWIENATEKDGKLQPLFEVDLNLARLNSKNCDVLYVQQKGKSLLSAKSKVLREFHKAGLPLNFEGLSEKEAKGLWHKALNEVSDKLKDFMGLMFVGESEPYGSPNSALNYFTSAINRVHLLNVLDFKNYYLEKVRVSEGKSIFAHHYKIALAEKNIQYKLRPEDLTLHSQIVLSYNESDLYQPMSVHVKSMRNEIEDIFGKRSHNRYKYNSQIDAYKSKLNKNELSRFEDLENILNSTLMPEIFPKVITL